MPSRFGRFRDIAEPAIAPIFILACLLTGCGARTTPKPLPRVRIEQDHWADLDFSHAKTGDWVEYEVDDGLKNATVVWKLALVEETPEDWWIEATGGEGIPSGWTVLARISRNDSLVTKCWIGRPGEETREVPVYASTRRKGGWGDEFGASEPGRRDVLTRESITVGTRSLECARVLQCAAGEEHGPVHPSPRSENPAVAQLEDAFLGMENLETRWWSQDVPAFRPPPRGQVLDMIAWEFSCRDWRGGLVRRIRKFWGSDSTEELIGFGRDAQRTLKVP